MQRPHRRIHAFAWMLMAIVLPLGLIVALLVRPDWNHQIAPVRLDPPGAAQPGVKP